MALSVRYWLHSTSEKDFDILRLFLHRIFLGRQESGIDIFAPSSSRFIKKILGDLVKGCARSLSFSDEDPLRPIIEKIITAISTPGLLRHTQITATLDFYLGRMVNLFVPLTPREPTYGVPDYWRTVVQSADLWRAVFEFWIQVAEADRSGRTRDGAKQFDMLVTIVNYLLRELEERLEKEECMAFSTVLVKSGLFEALDVALPRFAAKTDLFSTSPLLGNLLMLILTELRLMLPYS